MRGEHEFQGDRQHGRAAPAQGERGLREPQGANVVKGILAGVLLEKARGVEGLVAGRPAQALEAYAFLEVRRDVVLHFLDGDEFAGVVAGCDHFYIIVSVGGFALQELRIFQDGRFSTANVGFWCLVIEMSVCWSYRAMSRPVFFSKTSPSSPPT